MFEGLQKDHQLMAWQWLIYSGVICFIVWNFRKGLEAFWNRPKTEKIAKKQDFFEKNDEFSAEKNDKKTQKNTFFDEKTQK